MKKVLLVDPLSFTGHFHYNYGLIKAIAVNYDYGVVVNQSLYGKLVNVGIAKEKFEYIYSDKWNIVSLAKRMNKLSYHLMSRFYYLIVLLKVLRLSQKYDEIIFTSVDVSIFPFVSYLFKSKCAVVDHGIGNIETCYYYYLLWRLCSNKIKLIVMENYIKEMVHNKLHKKVVYVLRHPLPEIPKDSCTNDLDKVKIFAPSNSNDENYLKVICENNYNISIRAKSKSLNIKKRDVVISNQYISDYDYYHYLRTCEYVLLPYTPSYNYRISAVLFEALVLNKKVLLLDCNTLRNYKHIFPQNIWLLKQNDDLSRVVKEFKGEHDAPSNLSLYTLDALSKQMIEILS